MTFCSLLQRKIAYMAYTGTENKGKLLTQNVLVEQNKQQKTHLAKSAKKQLL